MNNSKGSFVFAKDNDVLYIDMDGDSTLNSDDYAFALTGLDSFHGADIDIEIYGEDSDATTITTLDGDDNINTGSGDDIINSGGGADIIVGLAGINTINSGAGNDTITTTSGADIINDISAGELDPQMLDVIAELKVPYIIMHMQGDPQNMQNNPSYTNIINDILLFFTHKIKQLKKKGIADIVIDPGFGFGKNNMHFSYSYDHTFAGDIMQYTYGTHEIGIAFRFETLATQRHIGFWSY